MCREKMKFNIIRVMCIIIALSATFTTCLLPIFADEAEEIDYTCGDELTWSFSAGTLTIVGSGEMRDFEEPHMAPWYHLRDEIRRIVFPEGLASVGNLAFYNCKNLTTVVLPESVKSIGHYSFAGCESLSMLRLGGNEHTINTAAFYGCISLDAVRLPYSLKKLGNQAFYRCESLTTVTIQNALVEMGTSVFAYCKNLVSVTINAPMTKLPNWTFYGCECLLTVVFPDTVSAVEDYAFKKCDVLSTIYFDGEEEKAEAIKQNISQDIPGFESHGFISSGRPPEIMLSGKTEENTDGTITMTSISAKQDENMTVVTQIDYTYPLEPDLKGNYDANIAVTIENKDGWSEAMDRVDKSLKDIGGISTRSDAENTIGVTVYMKDTEEPDNSFIQNLAGRELEITIVAPNGSSWQLDCSGIDPVADNANENLSYNYSFVIEDPTEDSREALGTDDCYSLSFSQSGTVNSEILVQLPSLSSGYSNAFLYQVEENGDHTRVQAVKVDQNAVAHFYVASVNKDVEYVIGINVPGESTDDVIIPDELMTRYGSAIERLEIIEYAHLGRETPSGLNLGQVMLIVIGAIVVTSIVVGAIMFMMNKKKNQQYRPA